MPEKVVVVVGGGYRRLWPPAYEQLGQQSLPQSIKWILIFPWALIKDLSINDPIPH